MTHTEKFTEKTPRRQIMKNISCVLHNQFDGDLDDDEIGAIISQINTMFWSNEELWEYLIMPVDKIRESGLLKERLVYGY